MAKMKFLNLLTLKATLLAKQQIKQAVGYPIGLIIILN